MLYLRQGLHPRAEPLLVKALEIRHRSPGEEHPGTLTAMNNLAEVYVGARRRFRPRARSA